MEIDIIPDIQQNKADNSCNGNGEDSSEDTNPNNKNGVRNVNKYCYEGIDVPKHSFHNKKIIKHALRQQAKRRKKNTTIASSSPSSVPKIIVKPLPPQPVEVAAEEVNLVPNVKTPTMKEVLASIPGFNMKQRKRSNKKLSTAAQLEQTKEGCIDLETPDSILVNISLRALLNKYTFSILPPLYQQKLVQLLPSVDRQIITNLVDSVRLNPSSLNNEFFARACLEWQERLAEGEFTPENQQKLKSEADKERSKLDPWKLKHFEPIWGDRTQSGTETSVNVQNYPRPPIKTTIKLRNSTLNSKQKPPPVKRIRTVGAVTRSCSNFKEESQHQETITKTPVPDLLPIRSHKTHKPEVVFTPIVNNKEQEMNTSNDVDPLQIVEVACTSTEDCNIAPKEELTIINISEEVAKNGEIEVRSDQNDLVVNKSEKRRRSLSSDKELLSPKRKTPTPTIVDTIVERTSIEIEDKTDEISLNDNITEKEGDASTIISTQTENDTQETSETTEIDNEDEDYENKEELTYETDSVQNENVEHDSVELEETNESLTEFNDNCSNNTNDQLSEVNESVSMITDHLSQVDDRLFKRNLMLSKADEEKLLLPETITESPEDQNKFNSDSMDYEKPVSPPEEFVMDDVGKDLENSNGQSIKEDQMKHEQYENQIPLDNNPSEMETIYNEEESEKQTNVNSSFLPSSLILQQETIVLEKGCTAETRIENVCMEDGKFEASVESDLVLSQLESNLREISDEDTAIEDRFIDAENYVLESGQIPVSISEKNDAKVEENIHTALFTVAQGELFSSYYPTKMFFILKTCCTSSICLSVYFIYFHP